MVASKPGTDANSKKLGDIYKACMDEVTIEKTAVSELSTLLGPIDKVKTGDDLAKELARQHVGIGKPLFDFSASPDFKNANQIIGNLDQSGLGLPDRDYYLKTDEKSESLRKEYLGHIERMLVLAGVAKDKAAAQAQTIFAIEKRMAQASMSRLSRPTPRRCTMRIFGPFIASADTCAQQVMIASGACCAASASIAATGAGVEGPLTSVKPAASTMRRSMASSGHA